jgi:hypothetical protein
VTNGSDFSGAALDEWRASSSRGGGSAISRGDTSNLADILERVLDKGVVIAGDIAINLVDVELLTIKLRLLVASVDKAREMGINWWENDPFLTTGDGSGSSGDGGSSGTGRSVGAGSGDEQPKLEERLVHLERSVDRLASALESAGGTALIGSGGQSGSGGRGGPGGRGGRGGQSGQRGSDA